MIELQDHDAEARRRLNLLLHPAAIVSATYGDILARIDVSKSQKWLSAIHEKSGRARYRAGGAILLALGWDEQDTRWEWLEDGQQTFAQAVEAYMGRSLGIPQNAFEAMDVWLEISDFVMTKSKFYERVRETRAGLKGIPDYELPVVFISDMIPADLEYYRDKNRRGHGPEETNDRSLPLQLLRKILQTTRFLYRTPTGPLDWVLNEGSKAPWEQWKRLTALHVFMERILKGKLTARRELNLYREWGFSAEDLRSFFARNDDVFVDVHEKSLFGGILRANKSACIRVEDVTMRRLVRFWSCPGLPAEIQALMDSLRYGYVMGPFYCDGKFSSVSMVQIGNIRKYFGGYPDVGRNWVPAKDIDPQYLLAIDKPGTGKGIRDLHF